jgi:hypothetical protein
MRAHLAVSLLALLTAPLAMGCGSASGLDVPEPKDDASLDASLDAVGDGAPGDGSTGDVSATCAPPLISCSTTGADAGASDPDAGDAATADGGGTVITVNCVDPRFDPNNCGGCGVACGATERCSEGKCAPKCEAPLVECSGKCVDPLHDPSNCGGCDTACVKGEVCTEKGCATECPEGQLKCGDACFDGKNDPKNCGACGTVCKTGEVCSDGKCADTCTSPLKRCGLTCVNLAYDPNNCGICGNRCPGTPCLEGGCGVVDKTDDDGDTISNFHESKGDLKDTDKDGKADYLDDDADGDGYLDKAEAGDTNVVTPPIDSDGDTIPDFQDTDSDNDGLLDKDERAKGTSPTKKDTDGDGYTDSEEVAAGTNPLDPASNPGTIGGFSFDLPYKGLARTQELTFRPTLKKADVAFLVDTTGSMNGSIVGIRTQLSKIAADLKTKISDTAFGVMDHKDFPVNPHGDPADFAARLRQRITTVLTDAQTGVNALTASGGRDLPESQIEAIYQMATGAGFRSPSGGTWVAKFDGTVGLDATKGHGPVGGMGFRSDAQPIIVLATDATFHHAPGDTENPSSTGSTDNYGTMGFGTAADQKPKTMKETLDALATIGAKFIGISVRLSGGEAARRQEEYFSLKTGTVVAAAGTTCPHGISGAAIPATDDGTGKLVCPLVFTTDSSGAGIDTAIVDAVTKLATFVNFKTVWLEARDNTTSAAFDERKFFKRGIPVSYESPLPAGCGAPSIGDLLPTPTPDGIFDSFTSLCPGTVVRFLLEMRNTDVPATCSDQVFSFKVVVIGDAKIETDARIVTVRVPGDNTLCK